MITLRNINKIYNKGQQNEFQALHDINLQIKKGEMVAIVGKSGAGKSTLLHILACIDGYDEGEYELDGNLIKGMKDRELAKIRNRKIGIVMQDYALVDDFSGIENVMLPLDFSVKPVDGKKKGGTQKRKIAMEALKNVEMEEFGKNPVKELSGGQKQRVAIARAIVNNPGLLLADEPTGALDTKTSDDIMRLLKRLNEQGTTIVIITHDMEVASRCDRKIVIEDGRIMSNPPNY